MTNVDALKILWAAIKGNGAKPDDLTATTTDEAIIAIARIYAPDGGELAALTVTSTAGTSAGKTVITVSGGSGGDYVYKTNTNVLPEYGEDLTAWTSWNGTDEITADDGSYIAVCEVDGDGKAVAGGTTMITVNLG